MQPKIIDIPIAEIIRYLLSSVLLTRAAAVRKTMENNMPPTCFVALNVET